MYRYLVIAIAALGIGSRAASAQPTRNPISIGNHPVTLEPIRPDLVAVQEWVPAVIQEVWTDTHPCMPHSHTHFGYVRIKGRFGAYTPAPTAILYRDGQPIETWTLTVPSGNQVVTLGTFTYTSPHPCPSGGNSVSTVPQPAPNYRLVVDPNGSLNEMSEGNNVVTFYVGPTVPFVRAP